MVVFSEDSTVDSKVGTVGTWSLSHWGKSPGFLGYFYSYKMYVHIYLVVGLEHVFLHTLGIIIPTDIFFRGVGIPPTRPWFSNWDAHFHQQVKLLAYYWRTWDPRTVVISRTSKTAIKPCTKIAMILRNIYPLGFVGKLALRWWQSQESTRNG
jgi:hypothetical protein